MKERKKEGASGSLQVQPAPSALGNHPETWPRPVAQHSTIDFLFPHRLPMSCRASTHIMYMRPNFGPRLENVLGLIRSSLACLACSNSPLHNWAELNERSALQYDTYGDSAPPFVSTLDSQFHRFQKSRVQSTRLILVVRTSGGPDWTYGGTLR